MQKEAKAQKSGMGFQGRGLVSVLKPGPSRLKWGRAGPGRVLALEDQL